MIKFWSALSLKQPFNSSKAKHTWPLFKETDLDQHKEKGRCVQAVLFLKCTFKIRKWKTYSCAQVLFYNFLLLRSFMLLARISEIKYLAWTIYSTCNTGTWNPSFVSEWESFWNCFAFPQESKCYFAYTAFYNHIVKKKKKKVSIMNKTNRKIFSTKVLYFFSTVGSKGATTAHEIKTHSLLK